MLFMSFLFHWMCSNYTSSFYIRHSFFFPTPSFPPCEGRQPAFLSMLLVCRSEIMINTLLFSFHLPPILMLSATLLSWWEIVQHWWSWSVWYFSKVKIPVEQKQHEKHEKDHWILLELYYKSDLRNMNWITMLVRQYINRACDEAKN